MKRTLLVFLFTPVMASIATAQPAAPDLTLRINGHADAPAPLELWLGEPVIAEVVLRHSDRTAQAPISLDPPGGGWASRVKIAVAEASGATAAWPFVVAGNPSGGAFVLQPDAVTTLVLRLDAAASAAFAAGRYHLAARLDLADGRGWRGVVESEPMEVEMVAPPVALTGAALGQRQLFRVRDALLASDVPRAEAAANELLRADYRRAEGFEAMALVSEAKGERRLALVYIDLATARAAGVVGVAPAPGAEAPAPKPVPLEYHDLRSRFEMMPSTEPEPEPLPGYPDNVAASANPTPAVSATPAPKPTPPPPIAAPVATGATAFAAASSGDTKFLGDSRGQWATGAEASSVHGTPKYGAQQATGSPNITSYADHPEAWVSQSADRGEEWLKLTFAAPVRASAVRVRQTLNPGTIVKIEAFAADGRSAVVWSGRDTNVYPKNQIAWFIATFEPPPFPVQTIKLTLDTTLVRGWNAIDAVQLVGDP
jgi:hypothetical protein